MSTSLVRRFRGTFSTTAASPFRSLADLLAAARAEPGRLTYSSGGVGSTHHMSSALLAQQGHEVLLLGMTTRGDQILDKSLSKVGGKGLFVKELEVALDEGRADLAVHSLKDVPMDLPEGFALACVMVLAVGGCSRQEEYPQAVRDAKQQGAEAVVHCGDVIGAQTLRPSLRLGLPLHASKAAADG